MRLSMRSSLPFTSSICNAQKQVAAGEFCGHFNDHLLTPLLSIYFVLFKLYHTALVFLSSGNVFTVRHVV